MITSPHAARSRPDHVPRPQPDDAPRPQPDDVPRPQAEDAPRPRLRRAIDSSLGRFIGIGIVSTLAYALLFLLLAGPLGSTAANALALVLTAVANTAANRRLTFGVRGRDGLLTHHLGGLAMFALSLAMTDGALALLHSADRQPARLLELTVLLAASVCATATRYVGFSTLLFRPRRAPARPHPAPSLRPQGS
jgi:putative flippase GtrA